MQGAEEFEKGRELLFPLTAKNFIDKTNRASRTNSRATYDNDPKKIIETGLCLWTCRKSFQMKQRTGEIVENSKEYAVGNKSSESQHLNSVHAENLATRPVFYNLKKDLGSGSF